VGLDGEARAERVVGGVARDIGRIDVEFLAPHQSGRDAPFDNGFEEATEHVQSVALAEASETGMVGERLGQVVPQIPAQTQAVGDDPQQLSFRAQPLEEEDQLHLKEDDRVDRGATDIGVRALDQIANEAQIERLLQLPREVVRGHQVLQRHRRQRPKRPLLDPHHGRLLLPHGGSAEGTACSHRATPFFNRLGRF
jgi:hypothetical protein